MDAKHPDPSQGPPVSRLITTIVAAVLACALVCASWLSQSRLEDRNRVATDRQAIAYARGVASTARDAVVIGDQVNLQNTIAEFAALPDVLSIDLAGADGTSWFRLAPDTHGQVKPQYTGQPVEVPHDGQPHTQRASDGSTLTAWHPLNNGRQLGWVVLRMSLDGERQINREMLIGTILGAVGILLATIIVLNRTVHRALLPLAQASRFAAELETHSGKTLSIRARSGEVRTLIDALNAASCRLREQYDALARRDAEVGALIATAPNAVIGLDDSGRVRLFNPAATSIFGPTEAQIEGAPVSQLVPSLDLAQIKQLARSAAHVGDGGLVVANDERIGLRNGETEFPIEIALSEVAGSAALRYTLIVRDITEQRMANDHLQIYMRALECSSNGMVIADARLPGLPLLWANTAMSRITGYTIDELTGRNCSFLQGNDRDQPGIQVLRDAIRNAQAVSVTLRNYRADGAPFWNQLSIAPVIDEAGKVTHFVGAATDITDRVLAEQAIARRNEQLDLILRMSPDGFALFDHRDRLVYANEAFTRMTGMTAEMLAGHADARSVLEAELHRNADPHLPWPALWNERGAQQTLVLINPERRILACEAKHSAGSGDCMLFLRDVTRESEVDRMKSEFLSTAAHELRTPLVSIFGFSELLLTRNYTPERAKPMIETIHRQSGLIVNLINELLDLARIEARQGKDFRMEVQAVQPIVGDTIASLLVPGDARVPVVVTPDEALFASIDTEKFRQALNNVLSNAYKYSPEGGEIRLEVLTEKREGLEMVGVRVSDQGIGMSTQQVGRAFERFFRADPSGNIPGTGLGLSIVKEIIELHGGQVDLTSTAGVGTTVTLWVQRRAPPKATNALALVTTAGA